MITDEVFSIAIGIIICQILLYIISNFANKNNTEKKIMERGG